MDDLPTARGAQYSFAATQEKAEQQGTAADTLVHRSFVKAAFYAQPTERRRKMKIILQIAAVRVGEPGSGR